MKFVEAFEALGYNVQQPRQDWSAEKDSGVCITLWKKELNRHQGRPYMDFWELYPDGEDWTSKSGNAKRIKHVSRALSVFDGHVDVVMISGEPGEGYGAAEPWVKKKRGYGWKIVKFDPASGFLRAEIDMENPFDASNNEPK